MSNEKLEAGLASHLTQELETRHTMIELLNCDCMKYMATVPHKTNARYLSDFMKSPEWFLTL